MTSIPERQPDPTALTPGQREIADLVTQGLSNQEIAVRLGMSSGRVTMQTKRVVHKLGLARRSDLMSMPDWS